MTKKFTEEEYQKIVEIADAYFGQHKSEVATVNLKNIYDYIYYNETVESEKIKDLNQELALIALPKSRDWAHEQFVEKEKKYHWRYKKTDEDGEAWYLMKDFGLIVLECTANWHDMLTEKEIIEAGYNPDMYEKEEVE
ncbi:hypothetical protein [Fructobacillus cardui]|uniref:hypothetical protein n=1 Tax=Fructobacillus cardui TaxID=2893170 RepID=UPI00200AE34F|nr:hypothetical protein [Fructobacillus cardui]MCK8626681.1 hypothetical protein [Fructobacillus cardui]